MGIADISRPQNFLNLEAKQRQIREYRLKSCRRPPERCQVLSAQEQGPTECCGAAIREIKERTLHGPVRELSSQAFLFLLTEDEVAARPQNKTTEALSKESEGSSEVG